MYLIDTNVVSEQRKLHLADPGVRAFFAELLEQPGQAYIILSKGRYEPTGGRAVWAVS